MGGSVKIKRMEDLFNERFTLTACALKYLVIEVCIIVSRKIITILYQFPVIENGVT